MSLISIGLSGLSAGQAAIAVTANNITNAHTPGYTRQQIQQTATSSQNIGVGFLGTGTTISDIRRVYSSYLDAQLNTATSLQADASAFQTQVGAVDKLLSDRDTGISSVLSSFFSALQTASAKPNDIASRQLLLTQAQGLSNRFNSIANQLRQQNDSTNAQLGTLAGQVNHLTDNIAQLNRQITAAKSAGGSPNDLLDARGEAVRQLNELVGVTVLERDGNFDVSMSNGQALVNGNRAYTMQAQPNANDPLQTDLIVDYGSFSSNVTSVTTGGQIGGLLRQREEVLKPAQNALGRMAMVVADRVNSQLGQGLDADGNFGASLFSSINGDLAMAQRSLASANNSAGSGNLSVRIANSAVLTTHDYDVVFTSDKQYSVRRSDGTDMGTFDLDADPAPVIDGFSLALKGGGLAAGDRFKITPTRNGGTDIATTLSDATRLAFSGPIVVDGDKGNTGNGSLTPPTLGNQLDIYDGADTALMRQAIKDSLPVRVVFDAASGGTQGYKVFDRNGAQIADGSIVPGKDNPLTLNIPMLDGNGQPIRDGQGNPRTFPVQTQVEGSPGTGAGFTVGFNTGSTADNRNAMALLDLQTKATVGTNAGGGTSFTGAYAGLVEQVGAKSRQATADIASTGAVLTSAADSRASVSSVSLDEEAGSLLRFQQYYTASSQIIKAAQETFTTLINTL